MFSAIHPRRASLGAALLLLACASVDTKHDMNPNLGAEISGWRTYAWLPRPETGDSRIDNDIVRARVEGYVNGGLAARGYRLDAEHPDFKVGWHAVIEEKDNLEALNNYYGYGYGWYGPSYPTYHEYNQGTLVLDFVDTSRNELAWRGLAEGRLSSKSLAIPSEDQIKKSVHEIMDGFPARARM